ncbi:hypothetical protein [Rhizobium sp. L245/93]|uniref:hypothetical protein n=1 Tax=Rhizobium sp. L245/93 TaxID=2819998 RepID=UPI001ADAD1C5|nr:hypothetical protein [Rhizobium sp. L245/93]MBO9170892.1 hypothetical protein [Rhizobium sp. L245/93]
MPKAVDGYSIEHLDLSESCRSFDAAMDLLRNNDLQVPPKLDPSQWVAENIDPPESKTYKPGTMRFTGYQRPIADAFMDENTREIIIMKGTRVGWSVFVSAMTAYGLAYKGFPIGIPQQLFAVMFGLCSAMAFYTRLKAQANMPPVSEAPDAHQ